MARWILVFATVVLVALFMDCSCDNEASYEKGYDDGYAVGYNTACEIRATIITGDWSNASYSEGYADGVDNGIKDCIKSRRSKQ